MSTFWAVATLLAVVAAFFGLCMLPFKRVRRRGKFALLIGLAGLVVGTILFTTALNREAVVAGFASESDRQAAMKVGIQDPDAWKVKRNEIAEQLKKAEAAAVEQKRKEAAEKDRIEAEQLVAEQAKCRDDVRCWGGKFDIEASMNCRRHVEYLAKNNFEWFDGTFEPKFSHLRWRNKPKGVITYLGDKIKFQNGFGAWIIHTYECDFDTSNKEVVDVRARPGRLPL